MSHEQLPMALPTLPGCAPGIVAMDDQIPRRWITVQCSGCFETRTDWPILAAGWALFPGSLRHGDERLCRKCRDACGCKSCTGMWSR